MSCALEWCVCDLTCFQVMWLVVRWFVVLLRYYSVLQRTTTYYSSTTPTYYSVLQRTTPVLLFTTKCYSGTTLYYKALRQYYSVLQSTTPVLLCSMPLLLCTTKYYSSTTLYYKVLRQYYNVLPSTTTYYSGTTLKRRLQCGEQQEAPSNFTKYCACHAKWISWLIGVTYETTFTMRGAKGGTLQLHQILRLPRKLNRIIDPHHICNVISNARSK